MSFPARDIPHTHMGPLSVPVLTVSPVTAFLKNMLQDSKLELHTRTSSGSVAVTGDIVLNESFQLTLHSHRLPSMNVLFKWYVCSTTLFTLLVDDEYRRCICLALQASITSSYTTLAFICDLIAHAHTTSTLNRLCM